MVHILTPGVSLRDKVNMALDIFAKERPGQLREWHEQARYHAEQLARPSGTNKGMDGAFSGIIHPFVLAVLQMDPDHTERRWGVRCGTGDNMLMQNEPKLLEMIWQESGVGKVSNAWGRPREVQH